jgi:hypothetical protein
MAVKTYSDGISRDTRVYGDNVYFSDGQGCDTIWFTTVPDARKFLERIGYRYRFGGHESGLCGCCQRHFSYSDKENWDKTKPHMCDCWKENIKKEAALGMAVV